MNGKRISLITPGVADWRRRELLRPAGWRNRPPSRCRLSAMGRRAWRCSARVDLAADQGGPGAALGTGAVALAQNFASEAEVDDAFARALAAATALKAPEKCSGRLSGYRRTGRPCREMVLNPFCPLPHGGRASPMHERASEDTSPAGRSEDRRPAGLLLRYRFRQPQSFSAPRWPAADDPRSGRSSPTWRCKSARCGWAAARSRLRRWAMSPPIPVIAARGWPVGCCKRPLPRCGGAPPSLPAVRHGGALRRRRLCPQATR